MTFLTKHLVRFGMAEQAINTIYLLGEQPDLLCGSIIKNLTAKVFSAPSSSSAPPPDTAEEAEVEAEINDDEDMHEDMPPVTPSKAAKVSFSSPLKGGMTRSDSQGSIKGDQAGAFSLAQLVFVVGHVAIKHIVYLELVEREFKRRKDENAKRELEVRCVGQADQGIWPNRESSGESSREGLE
jgi:condensin complex subunit 1